MYFSVLKTMKQQGFEDLLLITLDEWLGTRRTAIRNYLNPLQFSLDTGIDARKALSAFAACTLKDIGLLKTRFEVECDLCDHHIECYYKPNEIPLTIECPNCDSMIHVDDSCISVWFELQEIPEEPEYLVLAQNFEEGLANRGKLIASDLH